MAEIGTPAGSSHSGAIDGHWAAATVNRALGWAAGVARLRRPVLALPVDEVGRRGVGEALPPDVAVVGLGDVGEEAVARVSVARALGLVLSDVPGATPKKPASGLVA